MFDFVAMSGTERQFIRVYVQALRRHYLLFRSVTEIMNPSGLAVKSVADATRVAYGLADLHDEFETRLRRAQKKAGRKPVLDPPYSPTLDELATVFSLSFFKVVTTLDSQTSGTHTQNNGWFSGKPAEWQKSFLAFQALAKSDQSPSMPAVLSEIFAAALHLFHGFHNKWAPSPQKIWPPENTDVADWYLDDDDEDDTGDGPLDWFFNSE